jgi:hypothetical protein
MVPGAVSVAPGDTFEVTLEARALTPVSHMPVTVTFDPEVLAVERVEPGSFLGSDDGGELLTDASTPGRLVIGASRLGAGPGVAGSGPLVRVVFRAVGPGAAGLTFDKAKALDSERSQLALETRTADVEVSGEISPEAPAAPQPERPARDERKPKQIR